MKISTLASLVLLAAPLTAMADEQIPATAFTDWEYSTNHGPENVVDGDIDTYFETLKGQYTWVGLDLGEPHVISSIKIVKHGVCDLGVFQGANSRDFLDAIPLTVINQRISGTTEVTFDISCSRGFRYIRYVGPAGQFCRMAEIKVEGTPGVGDDSKLWQVTELPTVVVNTVNSEEPYDKEHDIVANIIIISENGATVLDKPGTIRERGNNSRSYPKKPWRLKFDKKTNVLDSPAKAKKWTLINNYGDKTLMRNILAFETAKALGMEFVPVARAVDVILNGEYKGTYQLCDQVEVNDGRVNVEELTAADTDPEIIKGGYLVEVDAYANSEPSWFQSAHYNIPVTIKSPDEDEITAAQKNYITNLFNQIETAIKPSTGYDAYDPVTGYRRIFDTRSFIQHMLTNEVASNTDCYWSTYMYKRRDDPKLYTGPVWDFDLGFENDRRTFPVVQTCGNGFLWQAGRSSFANGMYNFVNRILVTDPTTKAEIKEVWAEARRNGFSAESLLKRVDELAAQIDASQKLNFKRWPILSTQVHENPRAAGSYSGEVAWMKEYIADRIPHLDRVIGYDPDKDGVEAAEIVKGYIAVSGNTIVADGFAEGTDCTVYTLDGRVAATFAAGSASTPLLPGIYIVRAGAQTDKVVIR